MATRSTTRWLWLLASLVWIAGVAWIAQTGWPRISLDLPARDPAVRAAYDAAVTTHIAWHVFLALVPPAALLLLLRIFSRNT